MTTAAVNGPLWGYRAEDWAKIQEGQVARVFTAVLDRLGLAPGAAYLDVGCGAGMAAQMAAARGAAVSGLDASEEMLKVARHRTPSGDFRMGDIEELPFAADSFDAVTAFNSIQFASDPQAALAEIKRVAKPGAPVGIMTWATREGMPAAALVAAMKPFVPPPPPNSPGVFALSESGKLGAVAGAAGLEPQDLVTMESPWEYANLETALRGLKSAGVVAKALQQHPEEAIDAAFTEALAPFRQPDGSYRIGARFQYLLCGASS